MTAIDQAVAWLNDSAYPERESMTDKEARKAAAHLRIHWRVWQRAVFMAYAVRYVARNPDYYKRSIFDELAESDGFTRAEYMLANEKTAARLGRYG